MALSAIGLSAPYRQLLELLRVKPPGTSFINVRALEQLGIDVTCERGTLNRLYEHLVSNHAPIVPVLTGELPYWDRSTQHAVVVVGLDDEYVYLNDPAFAVAPIPGSLGDFELAWLGRDEYYAVLRRRG